MSMTRVPLPLALSIVYRLASTVCCLSHTHTINPAYPALKFKSQVMTHGYITNPIRYEENKMAAGYSHTWFFTSYGTRGNKTRHTL